ncbi:hypothetical protein BHM03_00056342, partial [Ensete ventricosum]
MSARLPIRGPPATGRFRQKSTVGDRLKGEIDHRRSIEREIDRRRSIEREKGRKKKRKKKKKKKRGEKKPIARAPSLLARRHRQPVAGALSPSWGERSRRRRRVVAARGSQRPRAVDARTPSLPTGRGHSFSHAGRKIKV